jgi:threonine dehydrogenase-like Zn-dependent dehydrogenase
LTALALARHLSPARLVVVDRDARKLDAARSHADCVLNITDADAQAALRRFAGDGASAVIDFVGTPETFDWAMAGVRRGATLVVVGLFGGAVSLPLPRLPMRHLALLGSYVGTRREFAELLALLRNGLRAPIALIEHPMQKIDSLLDRVERGDVAGRFVVIPT